jgi:hypothetical protein
MKAVNFLFCLFIQGGMAVPADIPGDDFCSIRNTTTQNGEQISYTVYYSVAGAYVAAGTASFTNAVEQLNGKTVYHVKGEGRTNSKYDWLYKVRDTYESFIDTANMQPLKFVRDVTEGSHKKYESISFNRAVNTAITDSGVYKVPACIQDVLSTIYYARNIDFSKYKPNDKIPFNMFLENEVHELYLRYLGRQEVKTKYGKFRAIKFKTLLVSGTIFKGGEDMTVWVSDDANHVPVRIETEILIGSIKVDMTGYKNLRYAFTSMEKKKGGKE